MKRPIKRPAAGLRRTAWGGALVAALATGSTAKTAAACGTQAAWTDDVVSTRSERAFIVWDADHHLEHFIRFARFDTKSPAFAFIVPVPHRPTLGEADALRAFSQVEFEMPPKPSVTRYTLDKGIRWTTLAHVFDRQGEGASPPRVLEEESIAGFDATVLEARDTDGLGAWLAGHHFPMREALRRWISGYVAKGWYFVLFRYEPGGTKRDFTIRGVRISFASDRPIYPYLEPIDAPVVPNRTLNLYLLAAERWTGRLVGDDETPWNVGAEFSDEIKTTNVLGQRLGDYLGVALPARMWLTTFDDPTTKRPPLDLAFSRSESQRPIERAPFVVEEPVTIPIDLVAVSVVAALVWVWRRRRLQHATASSSAI